MMERLKALFDPNRSIFLFVVGTATLTISLQALYDSAKSLAAKQLLAPELIGAWVLACVLFLVSASLILYQTLHRKPVMGRVEINEEEMVRQHKGLILLVSPKPNTAPAAIRHHIDTLEVCWFVASRDSLNTAEKLQKEFAEAYPYKRFIVPEPHQLVDSEEVADSYRRVVNICTKERMQYGLGLNDLIADITGGQKPMTAGMAYACLASGIDMQYMKGVRSASGDINTAVDPLPIRINQEFVPNRLPSG